MRIVALSGFGPPEGFQVGLGVSGVLAAFVTSVAVPRPRREPEVLEPGVLAELRT